MQELRLQFLTGRQRGCTVASSGSRLRLGRSRDNDLVVPDEGAPAVSRHHAEAVLEHGRWWLVDLESANGTFVNGQRVARHPLRSGDRVSLGGEELVVRLARRRGHRLARAVVLAMVVAGLPALLVRWWSAGPGFEPAATAAAAATYMIAVDDQRGRIVIGTAFAISRDGRLASNAHVAEEMRRRIAAGGRGLAVRTEPATETRTVARAMLHPGWVAGSIGNDVAVLVLEPGPATAPLPLARAARLAQLRRGTPVAAFGFPATATDPAHPRGRLTIDVLGEVRNDRYYAVGLRIAPGTSGSPIFLRDGTVVAMVAGGDFSGHPARETVRAGDRVNWGVSVAVLRELLEANGR